MSLTIVSAIIIVLPMEEVHEIRRNQHHSKIAIFAIVGFLTLLVIVVLSISKSLQSEQAFKTRSYATEIALPVEPGDDGNSGGINIPDPIGVGEVPIDPSCSGTISPIVDTLKNGYSIKCCIRQNGEGCTPSGDGCYYKWTLSCSDGRQATIGWQGCYTRGSWQNQRATAYCCNKYYCDAAEKNDLTLNRCEIQCDLAHQANRECEIKEFTDPTTQKRMISCCPKEKTPPPSDGTAPQNNGTQ